jgi:hypothetical protein
VDSAKFAGPLPGKAGRLRQTEVRERRCLQIAGGAVTPEKIPHDSLIAGLRSTPKAPSSLLSKGISTADVKQGKEPRIYCIKAPLVRRLTFKARIVYSSQCALRIREALDDLRRC